MKDSRLFAVFDLETNGFKGASAVSASSLVFTEEGRIVDFFNRFYHSEERPDRRTERVHGLTPERIVHFRTEERYPAYFLEDWPSLAAFWERWNPEGIVAHNLSFDLSFLPGEAVRRRKWWCSMRGLTDFCKIPKNTDREGEWKWPRLSEAVRIARERLLEPLPLAEAEDAVGPALGHYGLSDCFELYGLFVRVWNRTPEHVRFRTASTAPLAPRRELYPLPAAVRDEFVRERLDYSARVAEAAGDAERSRKLRLLATDG